MQHVLALFALLCLAPSVLIAQVIPVSGGGAALQLAVAAAPDGAVLVVAPGTYYPFAAQQRHLTIVAPQRANVAYNQLSIGPTTVDVAGVSVSQPMRLIGQRQWTPGGTSNLRCQEVPSTLAIVVASLGIVPNPTPLTSELLFAGAVPDWFVWTAGVTNVLGEFDFGLTLPNVPAALYASVWLHGLTGVGIPFHATAPLGGVIL